MKKTPKYAGALDVLAKVYAEKGFTGWYQVRYISTLHRTHLISLRVLDTIHPLTSVRSVGNERPDNESSPVSSAAVHEQGTVRAIRACDHDCLAWADELILAQPIELHLTSSILVSPARTSTSAHFSLAILYISSSLISVHATLMYTLLSVLEPYRRLTFSQSVARQRVSRIIEIRDLVV